MATVLTDEMFHLPLVSRMQSDCASVKFVNKILF